MEKIQEEIQEKNVVLLDVIEAGCVTDSTQRGTLYTYTAKFYVPNCEEAEFFSEVLCGKNNADTTKTKPIKFDLIFNLPEHEDA